MMLKQFNNPESGVPEVFEEFYNSSNVKLTHGMVVVEDLATSAKAQLRACTTTTTAADQKVAGVVFDPSGNGVAVGARGLLMRRGYHPAVNHNSAETTVAIGTICVTYTTAGEVDKVSAGTTVQVGSIVGYAAEALTAADTVIAMRVDVK